MVTKPPSETERTDLTMVDENKNTFQGHTLSKFEYDLYHEEEDVALPVIRVKHTNLPNKGDRWKIFEDNKVVFIVEGAKLTNKEKEFLRSVDGVNFLISQAKQGIKSFNALRTELKKKITAA